MSVTFQVEIDRDRSDGITMDFSCLTTIDTMYSAIDRFTVIDKRLRSNPFVLSTLVLSTRRHTFACDGLKMQSTLRCYINVI